MKLFSARIPAPILALTILGLSLGSCRYDEDKFLKPKFSHNSVFPVANSTLTMADSLESDSDSLLVRNPDNTYKIRFEQEVFNVKLDTVAKLPNLDHSIKYLLDTISIDADSAEITYSLGEAVAGSPQAGAIYASNGSSAPFPAMPLNQIAQKEIEIANIQWVQIQSGKMRIEFENGYPTAVDTFIYALINPTGGDTIVKKLVLNIPPGGTYINTTDLANKIIPSKMEVHSYISLAASTGNVTIDTSDQVRFKNHFTEMVAKSGSAIIPDQIANSDTIVDLDIQNGVVVDEIRLKSGKLALNGSNMFGIPITLKLTLSDFKKISDNSNLVVNFNLDARSGSTPGKKSLDVDLTQYRMLPGNTTGNDNELDIKAEVSVGSKGAYAPFNVASDSLTLNLKLQDMAMEYFMGFLGKDTIQESFNENVFEASFFDFLNDDAEIKLKNSSFKMDITSRIGLEAKLALDMSSTNAKTGKKVSLTGTKEFTINSALDNPLRAVQSNVVLDSSNSNIEDIISNLPKNIEGEARIYINPNGNPSNFIYDVSDMVANLVLEAPLSFVLKNLAFQDTVDFSGDFLNDDTRPFEDAFQSGKLVIMIENEAPIAMTLNLDLLDANYNKISTLNILNNKIKAAPVNNQVVASGSTKSQTTVVLEKSLFPDLRATKYLQVRAVAETENGNNPVVFKAGFQIRVKVNAEVNFKFN